MLKIGISACFFHEDPKRAIFKGMTLQYIEQNVAHWLMQRDVLAFMVPSPEGRTRRAGSKATIGAYAQELDGLVLMGGSDVCPGIVRREGAAARSGTAIVSATTTKSRCLRAFMALQKPVLGVCRGAQVINVGLGGTLYQDLAHAGAARAQSSQLGDLRAELPRHVVRARAAASPGSIPATTLVKTNSDSSSGGKGARPGPRRRGVVGARSHRRGDPLHRSGVRVRRPVASGVPRAGRPLVHRRHADPRRLPRCRRATQGRGVHDLSDSATDTCPASGTVAVSMDDSSEPR